MAETLIEDMLERVRFECRGCPSDLMVQKMRDTVRDFCQHTRAWQLYQSATITAAKSDYPITVPGVWAQPIAVEFMQIDERPAFFKTVNWLDEHVSDWRFRPTDDYAFFTQLSPEKFTLPCVPQVTGTAGGLKYRASYKPSDTADRIDSTLVDEWIETFADGALARLKVVAGERWSDMTRAKVCDALYRQARSRARIRVERSFGNAQQGWLQSQAWGAGRAFAGR